MKLGCDMNVRVILKYSFSTVFFSSVPTTVLWVTNIRLEKVIVNLIRHTAQPQFFLSEHDSQAYSTAKHTMPVFQIYLFFKRATQNEFNH